MIVSHFELIFKPQSPVAPPGAEPVDNLIQGYFLEITNLSKQVIKYALKLKTISVSDTNRSLGGNALVIVDRPASDNTFGRLLGSTGATTFTPSTGLIELEPHETALVAVLPSAFGPTPVDMTPLTAPTFEVRGIVELSIPSLKGPKTSLFTKPQATSPIETSVTPQNRTTYFKADGTISDQTQASLPISTGAAVLNIEPAKRRIICANLVHDFDRIKDMIEDLCLASDLSEVDILAGILATSEPKGSDLTQLNKAMADQGIGFAIERRTVKLPEQVE